MILVGDVHGCYRTLQSVLKRHPKKRVGLVGDLIDRGPMSIDVVSFVMDNQDRISCVRGNHEQMAIDYHDNPTPWGSDWMINGGDRVLKEYEEFSEQKFIDHIDFFKSLPFWLEFPDLKREDGRALLLSHSIMRSMDFQRNADSLSLIWGRHFPKEDALEGKWFNVFGHTPTPYLNSEDPILCDWYANIDTGCVYQGGKGLCALNFPDLTWEIFPKIDQ